MSKLLWNLLNAYGTRINSLLSHFDTALSWVDRLMERFETGLAVIDDALVRIEERSAPPRERPRVLISTGEPCPEARTADCISGCCWYDDGTFHHHPYCRRYGHLHPDDRVYRPEER